MKAVPDGHAPLEILAVWLDDARAAIPSIFNAMALTSVDTDGRPSQRMVLLKDLDDDGLIFFTNYQSRKARELDTTGVAAALFWWSDLGRQIRVEGRVSRLTPEASDAYFSTRGRMSQIGAWASPQSEPLQDRRELEERVEAFSKRFQDGPVPRPPHWGGYHLTPHRMEFWLEGKHRLHDRICFTFSDGAWERSRLAP